MTSTLLPDCAIKPPAAEAETRTIGLRSLFFVKRRAPPKVASKQRIHPQVILVSSYAPGVFDFIAMLSTLLPSFRLYWQGTTRW